MDGSAAGNINNNVHFLHKHKYSSLHKGLKRTFLTNKNNNKVTKKNKKNVKQTTCYRLFLCQNHNDA